ncbi:hypothetical protein D3C71_1753750 [compost metagenome]
MLQIVDPQPHAQGHVLALGKDHIDAIRRCGKLLQHRHQPAGRDFGLDLPGAAPGNAPAAQAPIMQYLTIRAIKWAA